MVKSQQPTSQQQTEGLRMGLDATKHDKQLQSQERQSERQRQQQREQQMVQSYNQAKTNASKEKGSK